MGPATRRGSVACSDSSSCSVAAPCTPDVSEKDTDGDSDDIVMGEGASGVEGSLEGEVAEATEAAHAAAAATQQATIALLSREAMDAAMEAAAQRLVLEMGENPLRTVSSLTHVIFQAAALLFEIGG